MRKIIEINEEKCIGCSLCVNACNQDALQLIDGKAKLVDDSYCDGLGMCLPQCPVDAIKITDVQNSDFNKTRQNIKLKNINETTPLKQWPIQLKLVRPTAEFFRDSNILIAADCTSFTNPQVYNNLVIDKSIVIACPKLDQDNEYVSKLAQIFSSNNIKTITLAIMEVPCCSGLKYIINQALELSNLSIPIKEIIIGIDGRIIK
ncbi:MAG: ATP-binding protein [Bacilli bacterium]